MLFVLYQLKNKQTRGQCFSFYRHQHKTHKHSIPTFCNLGITDQLKFISQQIVLSIQPNLQRYFLFDRERKRAKYIQLTESHGLQGRNANSKQTLGSLQENNMAIFRKIKFTIKATNALKYQQYSLGILGLTPNLCYLF